MFPHEFFAAAFFPPEYFPPAALAAVGNDVWVLWIDGD